MIRKILFPILTHVYSCIAFFVIFLLTWLGPEGGILLPLLPAPILFGATIILQMLAICIYIFIGIKSSSALKDTVCADMGNGRVEFYHFCCCIHICRQKSSGDRQ